MTKLLTTTAVVASLGLAACGGTATSGSHSTQSKSDIVAQARTHYDKMQSDYRVVNSLADADCSALPAVKVAWKDFRTQVDWFDTHASALETQRPGFTNKLKEAEQAIPAGEAAMRDAENICAGGLSQ